jgi:hypothetical protein
MEENVSVVLKKRGELSQDETGLLTFSRTPHRLQNGSIFNTVIMKHKEQS